MDPQDQPNTTTQQPQDPAQPEPIVEQDQPVAPVAETPAPAEPVVTPEPTVGEQPEPVADTTPVVGEENKPEETPAGGTVPPTV